MKIELDQGAGPFDGDSCYRDDCDCPECQPVIACHICNDPVTPETAHQYFFRCHAACIEAANARLMAAWGTSHPYDTQHEPGYACRYGPADIQIIAPATIEEYEALQAERDATGTPRDDQDGDPALAALLAGVS